MKAVRSACACVVVAVVVHAFVSASSAQNLLVNPGFEGQDGFQVPPGSCAGCCNYDYFYNCIPEVLAPTFWTPFWNDGVNPVDSPNTYRRPEFKVIPNQAPFLDPPRIRSGYRACQYFGFWGAIDAGYYQRVSVTPGTEYRFRYYAHSWSSCQDDPFVSGCDGNPPGGQATFKAGIDPTGGTDFQSANIVWGPGAHIYNSYQEVPAVTAVAQASTLTVFIRSIYLWGFKHNDSYIDDAELVVQTVPPTIELSTDEIQREVFLGGNLSQSHFTVRNSGSGTLNYTISDGDVGWLEPFPKTGFSNGEADDIAVNYTVSDLPGGEYTATITVSSTEAINSPQEILVRLNVETAPGDFDSDRDVDQADFGHLQACFSGPGVRPPGDDCGDADLDKDDDVDQSDFSIFQRCISGAGRIADRYCAD